MTKKIKIFGYGSLINKASLRKTVPHAKNIKPAKLYGFVRVFNFSSSTRFSEIDGIPCAVLNAEKSEWNQYINGIIFELNEKFLNELLERENGYEMVQVEVEEYEGKKHLAYFFRGLHFEAHPYQENSKKQKEYLEICYKGCRDFGEEFLKDFKNTTFIGKRTLKELNL